MTNHGLGTVLYFYKFISSFYNLNTWKDKIKSPHNLHITSSKQFHKKTYTDCKIKGIKIRFIKRARFLAIQQYRHTFRPTRDKLECDLF